MSLRTFWIETYGCQMNKAETESIIIQLKKLNMVEAEQAETADFIVLNTCSVRKTAEDRIWGRIGHYKFIKQKNPGLKLVITGCMAERLKEKLLSDGVVDLVVGNFEKHNISKFVRQTYEDNLIHSHTDDKQYTFFNLHSKNGGNFKAFIPIMHGCNNWCSYCIVPYVRGREVSRDPEAILSEIKVLEANGVREITLLGQNVNSYNFQKEHITIDFPRLLTLIIKNIKCIEWIRFLTSHPKDISSELIELIRNNTQLCRHIHLPVQHGSNNILKLMGRGYTREDYFSLIERIRNRIPDVSITSDILIGFPGENEEDYNLTLDLMQKIQFSESFTYKYNPREGTKSYLMQDTVTEAQKSQRLTKIIEVQRTISEKIKETQIGKTVKVLIESVSKKNEQELLGRTEKDETIVFPCGSLKIGNFAYVKIVGLNGNTFQGKEV